MSDASHDSRPDREPVEHARLTTSALRRSTGRASSKARTNDAAALRAKADVHLKQGDVKGAIGRYRRVVDREAEAGASSDSVARAYTDLADAFAYADGAVSAIRHFRRAIKLNPRKAEPHFSMAEVYRRNGRLREAVVEYRTAIEFSPRNAFYHFRLGESLGQAGFVPEAIAELEVAAVLSPADGFYHCSLSEYYLQDGRIDAAISEMQQATVFSPRDAYYNLKLGVLYLMSGLADDAAAAVGQAVSLEPRNALYRWVLGDILYELERIADADALYRRVGGLDSYDREHVRRIREMADLRGGWDLHTG